MCVSFTDFAINKNPYSLKDEYGVICSITVKHYSLILCRQLPVLRFRTVQSLNKFFCFFIISALLFNVKRFISCYFQYFSFQLTTSPLCNGNITDRFFAARYSFVFFIISVNYNSYTIASYGRSVTSESVLTQSA